MGNLTCPKCGGSDYFMSQRNVVKGMGWAQRGSIKSIPVCRVCDEIMYGAQVGTKSWEDLGRASESPSLSVGRADIGWGANQIVRGWLGLFMGIVLVVSLLGLLLG